MCIDVIARGRFKGSRLAWKCWLWLFRSYRLRSIFVIPSKLLLRESWVRIFAKWSKRSIKYGKSRSNSKMIGTKLSRYRQRPSMAWRKLLNRLKRSRRACPGWKAETARNAWAVVLLSINCRNSRGNRRQPPRWCSRPSRRSATSSTRWYPSHPRRPRPFLTKRACSRQHWQAFHQDRWRC